MFYRNLIHGGRYPNEEILPIRAIINFKKELGRFFFGEPQIEFVVNEWGANLEMIVSINCNYGITEGLYYLNSGDWGGFIHDRNYLSCFGRSLDKLREESLYKIDIQEFTINFLDTSIVVSKICCHSIADHLHAILNSVGQNFVHLTKSLAEMPYELFIPVFREEGLLVNKELVQKQCTAVPRSYFDYWGLYFYSNKNNDVDIYDLNKKEIIAGDLFFVDNQ